MTKKSRFTGPHWDLDTHYEFNDFNRDQVDTDWVDTITDTGTALVGDERGGIMTLTPSDGTVADNDEAYIATANELFLFADGGDLYAQFGIRYTETVAGTQNIAVGFQNAVAADTIVDNGGGIRTTGSSLAVYKVDGETNWRFQSTVNSVQTVTRATQTAAGATWYEIEIHCEPTTSTYMRASATVNGVVLTDANGLPIVHTVPYASATEMQLFAGVKLGAATNNDTLKVDYAYASQRRSYR